MLMTSARNAAGASARASKSVLLERKEERFMLATALLEQIPNGLYTETLEELNPSLDFGQGYYLFSKIETNTKHDALGANA